MVNGIYAGIVAGDVERARAWYAGVFGREPDAAPMDGLYEWHIGGQRVQLIALSRVRDIQQLPSWGAIGSSSITLVVDDAESAAGAAVQRGGKTVSHFDAPRFQTSSVQDPDGNLVTFIQLSAT